MDPSKIVVLVLTLLAVGFLVWVEMNSRRNTRAMQQQHSKQLNENPK
jgi:Flp pilus assembly protein CpaB